MVFAVYLVELGDGLLYVIRGGSQDEEFLIEFLVVVVLRGLTR